MNALEALDLRNDYWEDLKEAESKIDWIYWEENDEPTKKFIIGDLEQANWALRKIAVYKKKQQENEKLAEAEIKRIQNWLERENRQLENSIKFFEGLLEEYARKQKEKDAKFKLSTPYGKLTFRKQQPKWNYDEETLLKYLKQSGKTEFIRIKEEVNKSELKKKLKIVGEFVVDENGEIIEGITIEEQPEKVVIETEV
ncbi:host-nuclease inhibitor Gam family protein [Caloramator sp. Dgby_cultured_2]|uniref:host-nuclease inhibitor Gam family protein n=1 Tax=Caloramator sp. Dgby_cultured_2 TaxID=3029174 RepID=UPI00237D5937|nr:host-nuclease inhibitor Gam family protein [Caloramator sp. Dgby_cultured_2]WDU84234.1 host-nuclease inhibitor Gam family protein [Caloramator sp. Dgby_cultured_2]